LDDKKKHRIEIRIRNADPWAAGWITQYVYKMVDRKELEKMQITHIKKSEKSIELIITGVFIFLAGYIAGKVLDIPYNSTLKKLLRLLRRWKRKRRNMSLDIFIDGEPIE